MRHLKTIFIFIFPLIILMEIFALLFHWEADYFHNGKKYSTVYLEGFPFPASGLFTGINSMVTSGNSTNNWTYHLINQFILISISFILYYFIIKKIKFETKTKKTILFFILIGIYIFLLPLFCIFTSMIFDYDYGVWPEKIIITGFSFGIN